MRLKCLQPRELTERHNSCRWLLLLLKNLQVGIFGFDIFAHGIKFIKLLLIDFIVFLGANRAVGCYKIHVNFYVYKCQIKCGFINYIYFKLPTIKTEAKKLNTIKNEIFIHLAQ